MLVLKERTALWLRHLICISTWVLFLSFSGIQCPPNLLASHFSLPSSTNLGFAYLHWVSLGLLIYTEGFQSRKMNWRLINFFVLKIATEPQLLKSEVFCSAIWASTVLGLIICSFFNPIHTFCYSKSWSKLNDSVRFKCFALYMLHEIRGENTWNKLYWVNSDVGEVADWGSRMQIAR